MGIFHCDKPGHEGHLIGYERITKGKRAGTWHELTIDDEPRARKAKDGHLPVDRVQVACECGWRSPYYVAPFGTFWHPCCVDLPPIHEASRDEIWEEHMKRIGTDEAANVSGGFLDCSKRRWDREGSTMRAVR